MLVGPAMPRVRLSQTAMPACPTPLRSRAFHAFFLPALACIMGLSLSGGALAAAAPVPTSMTPAVTDPAAPLKPPVAATHPHLVKSPSGDRPDPYYWLRDDTRKSPEVLAYLNAENAYYEASTAHTRGLQDTLYKEIVARIKEDDSSVPVLDHGYWYGTRYVPGQQHPLIVRHKETLDAPEEILLDGNRLAEGHDYFQFGGSDVSPTHPERWLAYTTDTVGRRQYDLHFRDLKSGQDLAFAVHDVEGDVVWADDDRTLFYIEKNPETLLGFAVHRLSRHDDGSFADRVVYTERDPSYYLGLSKSKSGRYVFIHASATDETEWRFLDTRQPDAGFKVFLKRQDGHEYDLEHLAGDDFLVRTNWQAPNYRLMRAPVGVGVARTRWREVLAHRPDTLLESTEVFTTGLATEERNGGLTRVRFYPWTTPNGALGSGRDMLGGQGDTQGGDIQGFVAEAAYTATLAGTPDPARQVLRLRYTSMTTPGRTYDIDLATGAQKLLKEDPVLGAFSPGDYVTEHLMVPVRDDTLVPVSLVYRKGTRLDGSAPLYQYGYGSYGLSMDPTFSVSRLSLLDRGFVYAIAHVRGGEEMGRAWYEAGRQDTKQHTFDDFVDVTEALVARGYGDPGRVYAAGGSAGGLLMGAIANQRPELYDGIVAHVPFVDVVTTMLDTSIPLTTNEYDEWGNPAEAPAYKTMLAYSPYDNVRAQPYPAMLVTTGLWDSQVQYYEPAKWVARLRATMTGGGPLYLKTDMSAGHGGKAGRYERYREVAEEYAFVIDRAGMAEKGGAAPKAAK